MSITTAEKRQIFGHEDQPSSEIQAQARSYLSLRLEFDRAEKALADMKKKLQDAETRLVLAAEREQITSLPICGERLVFCTRDYYRVRNSDLEDNNFVRWLLRSGGHGLLGRSVNASSFSKFCRELVEAGKPILGCVSRVTMKYIRKDKACS